MSCWRHLLETACHAVTFRYLLAYIRNSLFFKGQMHPCLFQNVISMVVLKRFRQVRVIFFRYLRSPASLLRHFLHVTSAEIPASRLQTPLFVLRLVLCPFQLPLFHTDGSAQRKRGDRCGCRRRGPPGSDVRARWKRPRKLLLFAGRKSFPSRASHCSHVNLVL